MTHHPKAWDAAAEGSMGRLSRLATKSQKKRGSADGRIRTDDPLFTKQLLCQLSYVGVRSDYMERVAAPLPLSQRGMDSL